MITIVYGNTVSTEGCGCCSNEYDNIEENKQDIINELQQNIIVAKECSDLIGYDFNKLINGYIEVEHTKEEIQSWKDKAEKWDGLKKEVSKFYCNADGEYDEENPERKGDLVDIGEEAAIRLGWL